MKQRVLIAFVLLLVPIASAQVYTITDLGPLSPTAINNWAQVVGNYNNQAYIWSFGRMHGLGTLKGGTSSKAIAINDLGVVAGQADGPTTVTDRSGSPPRYCNDVIQAMIWSRANGMRGLGMIGIGGDYFEYCDIISYSTGINIRNEVVGVDDWAENTYQDVLLWTKSSGLNFFASLDYTGSPEFLAAYYYRADAIDNHGQAVGAYSDNTFGSDHAVLYGLTAAVDLGTLGGDDALPFFLYCSEASSMNDLGQIVGWSSTEPESYQFGSACETGLPLHAVFWNQPGTSMRDLGTLLGDSSSLAYKINLFGQVVGVSGNTVAFDYPPGRIRVIGRPFLWAQRDGMRDLNTLIPADSGWLLNTALDINVWGQIVGSGTRNGQQHGYLLTPKNPF